SEKRARGILQQKLDAYRCVAGGGESVRSPRLQLKAVGGGPAGPGREIRRDQIDDDKPALRRRLRLGEACVDERIERSCQRAKRSRNRRYVLTRKIRPRRGYSGGLTGAQRHPRAEIRGTRGLYFEESVRGPALHAAVEEEAALRDRQREVLCLCDGLRAGGKHRRIGLLHLEPELAGG